MPILLVRWHGCSCTATSSETHHVNSVMHRFAQSHALGCNKERNEYAAYYATRMQNIKRGNQELKSTVKINRSTQRHILVLLLAATLGLLFFDWFNS